MCRLVLDKKSKMILDYMKLSASDIKAGSVNAKVGISIPKGISAEKKLQIKATLAEANTKLLAGSNTLKAAPSGVNGAAAAMAPVAMLVLIASMFMA